MPCIAAAALQTRHGDTDATLAALIQGTAEPGQLPGDILTAALDLARSVVGNGSIDVVILATTKGDCDRWADALIESGNSNSGSPTWFAQQIAAQFGVDGFAVSGACASGPLAIGVAARGMAADRWRRVLVIGADRTGPFISEGFTALKALAQDQCRPFDANRTGLRLGEQVAALLLTHPSEATDKSLYVRGWGASLDGNHLTGPTRDGSGMARAVQAALRCADNVQPQLIIAHGTGTRYNDDSESLAYASCCPGVPVTGVKGILGHTLGSCGIGEAVLATSMIKNGEAAGCAHLQEQGCAGEIRVLPPGVHQLPRGAILGANAGFGGINGTYVIDSTPTPERKTVAAQCVRRISLSSHGWEIRDADQQLIKSGEWDEAGLENCLPKLSARMVLGRVDASWGRMDLACRALVTMGHLVGPWSENTALILATERGSAASDRLHEQARRAGSVDPQRFAYTLPTTPVGEASIRLGIRGLGLTVHGAPPSLVQELATDLLTDGFEAVFVAHIEADLPPHLATGYVLTPT